MGQITEFQYAETDKRKYIYLNSGLSFLACSIIVSTLYSVYSEYFGAFPPDSPIIFAVIAGLFAGNLAGRPLFNIVKRSVYAFALIDILFIAALSLFFLRTVVFKGNTFSDPLIELYIIDHRLPPAIPFLLFFLAGMKSAYFTKVVTGEFIDNRQGIVLFIFISISMSALGLLYPLLETFIEIPRPLPAVSGFLILLTTFFIRLQYSPGSLYAKVFERDPSEEKEKTPPGERLFFSFLNIAFMIVYSFLSYTLVIRSISGIYYIKLAAAAGILLLIMGGYVLASRFRIKENYMFNSLFFPPMFLAFVFIAYSASGISPLFNLTLIPSLLLYGYTLNQLIRGIKHNYPHKKRYAVINFMFFIMPYPILAALAHINFTNSWFFISVYTVAAANLIIQSVNIAGKKTRPLYKGIFLTLFFLSIPALIFIHIYLKLPLDNRMFINNLENFDQLKNVNYNVPYLKDRITLKLNGDTVFILNDSVIRNMKRSLVPLALYMDSGKDAAVKKLIIDGYQKFFRNPVAGYFENTVCVDTVPSSALSNSILPFSGRQRYIAEESGVIDYLKKNPGPYQLIAETPDIYTQTRDPFKYSNEYISFIKQHLSAGGVYTVSFNINRCRGTYLSAAAGTLKNSFKYHRVYLFTEIMLIVSSDSEVSLSLNRDKTRELSSFIKNNDEIAQLFFSEYHLLSKMLFRDIESLQAYLTSYNIAGVGRFSESLIFQPDENMLNRHISENNIFLDTIDKTGQGIYYYNEASNALSYTKNILTQIKQFEKAEAESMYDIETARLFELKRYAEYNPELARYIKIILTYKEDYYAGAARNYEKTKNWEEAKKLYLAVLAINRNNFEANYRLGILYLVLQDLGKSFEYLKNAMTIDSNNPSVFFQMGVLNFSEGKFNEAIAFLNKAVDGKEHTAPLYKYLGLSHEKIGNTNEAEIYFEKSLILDPNDTDTIERLNEIKKARAAEQRGWIQPDQKSDLEVEKGVKIDIPVNRSAYDLRLGEKGEDSTGQTVKPSPPVQ
jgi:tetratricopeptide (TPR) repeat protein